MAAQEKVILMGKLLKLRTFNYSDAPKRGEGLRIGTTRRPPRGAKKDQWHQFFDVWFPAIAPSVKLLARMKNTNLTYEAFCASYERELLATAESRGSLQLLAALALRTPISIGCYCDDESRCHRSHLRKVIERIANEC